MRLPDSWQSIQPKIALSLFSYVAAIALLVLFWPAPNDHSEAALWFRVVTLLAIPMGFFAALIVAIWNEESE